MNTLHTMGRLTADPEMREVGGANCLNFTLASDTRNKDAEGNKLTNFYRVTAWRKTAEIMQQYLHKGDKIYVEGELCMRRYKDANGNDRVSPDLTVSQFEFVQTSRANAANEQSAQNAQSTQAQSTQAQGTQAAPPAYMRATPVETDELPF